jgi:hypothetical protein
MAKVKQVHSCRACGADLYTKDQAVCHACGTRLNFDEKTRFDSPDYLFYQRGDLVMELDSRGRDYETCIQEIDKDLINFIKKSDPEDKIASLYDAFFNTKYIILSESDTDTLKQVVKMGKLIGELSKSIELYAKNQGAINATRGVDPTKELGDDEGL